MCTIKIYIFVIHSGRWYIQIIEIEHFWAYKIVCVFIIYVVVMLLDI